MSSLKYFEGEIKKRPGLYNRTSNADNGITVAGAINGIGAIAITAPWGPVGEVKKFSGTNMAAEVALAYGATGNGPESVQAFINGGLDTLYVYRVGTGGTKSTITLDAAVEVSAKYPGTRVFNVQVRASLADSNKKEMLLFEGTTLLQKYEFAGTAQDLVNVITASESEYITATALEGKGATALTEAASTAMTAGTEPTVTNTDYSVAFAKLEPYTYNVITIDKDDAGVRALLANYAAAAEETGKRIIVVFGTNNTVAFSARCTEAKSYNAANVCFCGSGYYNADGKAIGKNAGDTRANAIMAGYIAASPTKGSVIHQPIAGAVDVVEKLTNTDYVTAIESGLLLLSVGSGGQVWFDSGVNTLTNPAANQDEGWKKIKRVKIRYELLDRMDRTLEPFVGQVNAVSNGFDTIIQAGQKLIDTMIQESKLLSGSITLDKSTADSGWFSIVVVDADTLEKIYLHYQFRYSQNG